MEFNALRLANGILDRTCDDQQRICIEEVDLLVENRMKNGTDSDGGHQIREGRPRRL